MIALDFPEKLGQPFTIFCSSKLPVQRWVVSVIFSEQRGTLPTLVASLNLLPGSFRLARIRRNRKHGWMNKPAEPANHLIGCASR